MKEPDCSDPDIARGLQLHRLMDGSNKRSDLCSCPQLGGLLAVPTKRLCGQLDTSHLETKQHAYPYTIVSGFASLASPLLGQCKPSVVSGH